MAPTFEDVYREKYLLLTTFTKDGKPKPTAVWGVPDGDRLLIITDDGSWKTKRINNTGRVTIQKCGVLGAPKGEPVEAVARNLPKAETRRVFDAIVKRYWNHAWYFIPQALLRGGVDKVHSAIEVRAAGSQATGQEPNRPPNR
ncbi:PPOX class F420-dependent oxidoreductase [Mycobacterium sp. 20091114027_K0903767]|uniref:PPOX class F420-dependent oxidoreductase n=1 Tax=Mycolicibacterium porcinum TaxID=39693 RepID=UPI001C8CD8F9|nr:PPOX class F420-dependent oxidoreductase [Mycobacterium sp. 20091114027_K0903767]